MAKVKTNDKASVTKKKIQTISRKGSFDSGHRVMNERMKCYNIHGHTYLYTLTFSFINSEDIGYAIDFKEVKRVGCQWIDDMLDHGMILNPHDTALIHTSAELQSKLWLMSLNGLAEYCNPTVENIAKEIFLAMEILFPQTSNSFTGLKIHKVKIFETPNCYTTVKAGSISERERLNFRNARYGIIRDYWEEKGIVEYDDRKAR